MLTAGSAKFSVNKRMKKVQLKLLLAVFGLALLANVSFAQKAQPTPKTTPTPTTAAKDASWPNFPPMSEVIDKPDVRTLKLNSKLMGREMPYQIILPRDYDDMKLIRYPVIYLLHGLGGHYDNWTNKTRLAEYARGSHLIIVTVEGGDGWYTDSVSAPNDKYESYIVQELIPEIDKNFRTKTDRANRAIAGLSMGGYGAIKFGLKYPDKFVLAGSFSGALMVTDLPASAKMFSTVKDVFGEDNSETRKQNDDMRLLRDMPADKLAGLPFLYVACGTEDGLVFPQNQNFMKLMTEKKVRHEYRQLPGTHSWPFWDGQILEFLRLAGKYFQQ
jgi:putative tributyrin esterase